jgi:hypothetical protein
MISMPGAHDVQHYGFRVTGHLDDHWAGWFGDLLLTRADDGTTTLRGPVSDQAALHSLLAKIRDTGMVLLSVHIIDRPPGPWPSPGTGPDGAGPRPWTAGLP